MNSIGILVLIIYLWQIKKYKKKRREFQRSEIKIFELSSRETILKREHTLRDRLSILGKKEKYSISGTNSIVNISENDNK